MIDIHSHILWGIDDGARDRETSVAMLKLAAETGTTDIVATPHSDMQFKYDAELVTQLIAELQGEMAGAIKIHKGCDFHMSFENVQACLENPTKFTINGLGYLMVEFADTFIPPSTEEIFRQFSARGITPVITHPERNPVLQGSTERLQRWIESGCLVQVTAQSVTDRFGKAAQQAAWKWLKAGLVHVLASDAHDTEHRPPRLDLARDIMTSEMGADVARMLLEDNPGAVINGERVWMQVPVVKKKKWFFF